MKKLILLLLLVSGGGLTFANARAQAHHPTGPPAQVRVVVSHQEAVNLAIADSAAIAIMCNIVLPNLSTNPVARFVEQKL